MTDPLTDDQIIKLRDNLLACAHGAMSRAEVEFVLDCQIAIGQATVPTEAREAARQRIADTVNAMTKERTP